MKLGRARAALACVVVSAILPAGRAAAEPAVTAAPEVAPDYAAGGFYAWVGLTQAVQTRAEDEILAAVAGTPLADRVTVSGATGLNARFGARGRHIAGELQVEYLPGFDIEVSDVKLVSYALLVFGANLKLHLPMGRFDPYALAGVGVSRAFYDAPLNPRAPTGATGAAFRFGGGANIHLDEHVALAADVTYLLPTGDNESLAYVSIGLGMIYRF